MKHKYAKQKAAKQTKESTAVKNEPAELKTPWMRYYGEVPFHLDYPDCSMSEAVERMAKANPDIPALSFMKREISYGEMMKMIDRVARAFYAIGVRPGQRVSICMPNVPQTVYCLYALNRIGAVASMIHPLSAVGEIVYYLKEVESEYIVTLDQFYDKFVEVEKEHPIKKMLISSVADELRGLLRIGYKLTEGRKIPKVPKVDNVILWQDFLSGGDKLSDDKYLFSMPAKELAVVLFSGGTTGVTKGIGLSNLNFNALALQTEAMCHQDVFKSKMLAAMPMFHGFGLGVCVHTVLVCGGCSILVPRFNVKEYADLIKKHRPNFIAGVPTLFEAITRNPYLDGVSLDCLRGVFSGGDSLSIELKKRFDKFLDDHHSPVHVREGYGATECVTASCLTPYTEEREGSIGLPFPDTYYQICGIDSNEELPYGEEGEICLTGPSVMLGYLNKPEENAKTLRRHADGHVWLHTGDLGMMDEDGFIYFRQRLKRMIITSGYNVYPSQLENVIEAHEAVEMSCVIGVRDPYKMQKVKAFVVLKDGYEESEELKESLFEHCRARIAKYAMPYDIEIRKELPKTLVGKIAYTVLEQEMMEQEAQAALG